MASRRGHGEGSIYYRERDGLWCSAVNLGYVNGRRRRKVIYGKTRKEVAEKLTKVLHEQHLGLPISTERQTVAAFLDRWLEDVVKPGRRVRTYEVYRQLVTLYIGPAIGHHRLDKLTPQHVQALMTGRLKAGLSPRTVQFIRAVLRRALGQAVKWGLVARNVATLVDPPRTIRKEIIPLTPAQCRQLLEAARGDRLEVVYRVTLSLGLRLGEVLGLRWQDIDLDARTMRVVQSVQRAGGRLVIDDLKTERSRRTLPLTDSLITSLKAQRSAQRLARLVMGERWQESGLVFTTRYGTPLEPRNVQAAFKRLLVTAGLPKTVRFHDLRHSCASLLADQGVSPRTIMEMLGHSQVSVTLDIYTHAFASAKREAVDRLDALLPAATSEAS